MAQPTFAALRGPISIAPFTRSYAYWLVALLLVHAGIAAWAISRTSETPWLYYRHEQFLLVSITALGAFALAFAIGRRYVRAIAWNAGIIAASALLTPAVVLLVGLQLLNAFVVGATALRFAAGARAGAHAPRTTIAILAGISLWTGIISATASMPVHYLAVYALALVLPLVVCWRTTASALARAGKVLVEPQHRTSVSACGWMVLLMALVVLHLFVVAKPEAGYDATAMHLQIAMLMAHAHQWPFDVTRYVWAVMPLGADWGFTAAFIMGGEGAARLFNFCFAVIAGGLVYELICLEARRGVALLSVCLFASAPLVYLQTSTLHVESLWTAFLLAALLVSLDWMRDGSIPVWAPLALLAAGAMQCKVIGVFWLIPLLGSVLYRTWRRRSYSDWTGVEVSLVALSVAFAAWPYANAWIRTGNPVFPFMNAIFRSPYFATQTSFNNPLYNAPLRPWSVYELVWSSGRFTEGFNGAAGFHWLLLFPFIALAYFRWRALTKWLCLALAAIFFVAVYSQQSYLRYLMPFFALLAVLGGWAIGEIPDGVLQRTALLVAGAALCAVNVRFMYAANWSNLTLCAACAFDDRAAREYLALYAPDRLTADYLNRNLPDARVGFMSFGGNPAGFVGYSRAGNWHDNATFWELALAESVDDVAAWAKRFQLTHIVYRDPPIDNETRPMQQFRARYTTPIWRANGVVVAKIAVLPGQ